MTIVSRVSRRLPRDGISRRNASSPSSKHDCMLSLYHDQHQLEIVLRHQAATPHSGCLESHWLINPAPRSICKLYAPNAKPRDMLLQTLWH